VGDAGSSSRRLSFDGHCTGYAMCYISSDQGMQVSMRTL
jgi:hypothetical protein